MDLKTFFAQNNKVALGFSGGVDSAYLLWAAVHYGADVRPYFVKSAFQPTFELEDAQRLADFIGCPLTVLELDVLAQPQVVANPADRCYHCKHTIFSALQAQAKADGYPVLMDGTNASDEAGDRPGMRALAERAVLSPLRECGITKAQIRQLSKDANLFTWDKPSYACLATRIPTNMPITAQDLSRVEQGEGALHAMGYSDFRIRVLPDGSGKLQLPAAQMERAFAQREELVAQLRPYFTAVVLDLIPR